VLKKTGVRIRQQSSLVPIPDFKPQIAQYTDRGRGAKRTGLDSHWANTCLLLMNSEF
jgi:hypothetical protein